MPLKHLTETVLIIALAAVTALAAFAVSVLPPLPAGLFPWGVLFALTLVYPLALYGLFRTHRADKPFRFLHFAPMLIALLWLALQLLQSRLPQAGALSEMFTWLYGAGPLLFVYALIAAFCLHVIRRRFPRLTALGLLAAAFVAFAVISASRGWDTDIRTTVADLTERAGLVASTGTGSQRSSAGSGTGMMAQNSSSRSSSVAVSSARRAASSIASLSSASSLTSRSSASSKASSTSSSRLVAAVSSRPGGSNSSAPPTPEAPHLPSSGFGAEGLATVVMAGYCSVLHVRARKRMV